MNAKACVKLPRQWKFGFILCKQNVYVYDTYHTYNTYWKLYKCQTADVWIFNLFLFSAKIRTRPRSKQVGGEIVQHRRLIVAPISEYKVNAVAALPPKPRKNQPCYLPLEHNWRVGHSPPVERLLPSNLPFVMPWTRPSTRKWLATTGFF